MKEANDPVREVKGQSKAALIWKYLSFWLRFDVKGICFCFDGIVGHAVFNIHGADQKKRRERSGEKVFGQTES